MAFKPSSRKKSDNDFKEPDMIVVMNLMVCLIPLLLSCAEFVKLGTIEINLPTSGGSAASDDPNKPPPVDKPKLDLKLFVTEQGFSIQTNLRGIEPGPDPAQPTVPVTPGDYNVYDGLSVKGHWPLKQLNDKLAALKKEISGQDFSDNDVIEITADSKIPYQVLIKTMDMVKATYEPQTNAVKEILFPNIALGVAL